MTKYPQILSHFISILKKLPGVGTKTAERFAFDLLQWSTGQLSQLAELCDTIKEKIINCPECNCLMEKDTLCPFCDEKKRETHLICITASPKDVYAIEETRSYRGLYHVLGGLLSPLEGMHAEHLRLSLLKTRIIKYQIKEVILALDSTIEGDATALFLKEMLSNVHVSRLAFGLPIGSSLDFVDGTTLTRALTGRHVF